MKEKELFERKPILSAIMSLALPSILGQIILVIYNMADTYFVGLAGSDSMITAVTVCTPAFMFLSAISNLFGVGGASVIARALGGQDLRRVRGTFCFAFWGCVVLTAVYCVLAGLFSDAFIRFLGGGNPTVHANAKGYLMIAVVWGGLATSVNTLLSHLIRAQGYSFQASLGIALGGVLNVILDPIFMFVIFKPGSEVLGAAAATAVSNALALLYFLLILIQKRDRLVISVRPAVHMLQEGIPRDVISVGIPACLMTFCENLSYSVLDHLMAASGTAAQAGIGVAKKVNMLSHCIVRGMTQGVLPLIGYCYASHNEVRMKKTFSFSVAISLGISLICMGACLLFSRPLIRIFVQNESDSLYYGMAFLKILCIGAPFSAFAYSTISFFQAVGRGKSSLVLALLRKGILDIPLMFILGRFLPTYGYVWATPGADVLCCLTAVHLLLHSLKTDLHQAAQR